MVAAAVLTASRLDLIGNHEICLYVHNKIGDHTYITVAKSPLNAAAVGREGDMPVGGLTPILAGVRCR